MLKLQISIFTSGIYNKWKRLNRNWTASIKNMGWTKQYTAASVPCWWLQVSLPGEDFRSSSESLSFFCFAQTKMNRTEIGTATHMTISVSWVRCKSKVTYVGTWTTAFWLKLGVLWPRLNWPGLNWFGSFMRKSIDNPPTIHGTFISPFLA